MGHSDAARVMEENHSLHTRDHARLPLKGWTSRSRGGLLALIAVNCSPDSFARSERRLERVTMAVVFGRGTTHCIASRACHEELRGGVGLERWLHARLMRRDGHRLLKAI